MNKIFIVIIFISLSMPAFGKIKNNLKDNSKTYGREIKVRQFSKSRDDFTGKITYKAPYYDWDIEVIYTNGISYSETARPNENTRKKTLTDKEASTLGNILFPKEFRGAYRKQVKNSLFESHFYQNGVISYETKLDEKGKSKIGVQGVRAVQYHNGGIFNTETMVNAYH